MIVSEEKLAELIQREIVATSANNSEKIIKDLSFYIKKYLFSLFPGSKNSFDNQTLINPNKIKRVLILRNDAIGDYVVSSGAIRALKTICPKVKIDVLASSKNRFYIEKDPVIDNVYVCDAKSLTELPYKYLKNLRKNDYDAVFVLNFSRTTVAAAICSIVAPNAEKITVLHKKRAGIYGQVFNRQIDIDFPKLTWSQKMTKCVTDAFELNEDIALEKISPYTFFAANSQERVLEYCEKHNLKFDISNSININSSDNIQTKLPGQEFVIVNISAGKASNEWDKDSCLKFTKQALIDFPDYVFVVSGSPADFDKVDYIVKHVNSRNCISLKGDLFSYIVILAQARALVSPDTGVVHLAASLGTPVAALYPAEYHLIYWRPSTKNRIMLIAESGDSVNGIDSHEINMALSMLLKRG